MVKFIYFFILSQEPGRSTPAGKILVKEAPEMLAIAHWTGITILYKHKKKRVITKMLF